MSKSVIRKGVFETNSSSVHSICIAKKNVTGYKGEHVDFYLGKYGWEFGSASPADYLYTAIMCQPDGEEFLDKLKSILDEKGITYSFQPINKTNGYMRYGGIDHSYDTRNFVDAVLSDKDMLMRYLFNPDTSVYTGNDNSEGFERFEHCYQGYTRAWDDDDNDIPNPYHDETKFDYFVKGN